MAQYQATDDSQLLAEAAKLSILERAANSNWKVRAHAYDEVKDTCGRMLDAEDPWLSSTAEIFLKACSDSSAAALDKALEALVAFAGTATDHTVGRIARSASAAIVAKSLGARPITQQKAIEALLQLIEADQADKVMTEIVDGYGNKVPKVVVGALDATLAAIRAFGGRALPANTILKALPPLFDSKDAKARDRVKEIVAELARWMGPDLIRASLFEKMRDAMKGDVEKLLQDAPAGRPKPERLTRKAAEAQRAAGVAAGGEVGGDGTPLKAAASAAAMEEPEVPDSYEFAEPRDILPSLKKDFWDGLVSAKWSERKEALAQLRAAASYPRLAPGDFFDINQSLRRIITKDSNIQVVAEAIACTAALASGLRREYASVARGLAGVLLEKFKDKASVVAKGAREALDVLHRHCFTVADVAEDVVAALGHQNPKVKEGALGWLEVCLGREAKPGVTKIMKDVVPAAAKCTDEGSPTIREAALAVLVVCALKLGSLVALDKATAKMDEGRKKRLEEMAMAAIKGGGGGGAAAGRHSAAASAAPAAAAGSRRGSARPSSGQTSPSTSPRSAQAPPARKTSTAGTAHASGAAAKPPAGRGRPAATSAANSTAAAASGTDDAADEASLVCGLLNKVEAEEQLEGMFGQELVAQLQDPQWKVRLEAMDAVVARAQDDDAPGICCALAQALQHFPGWDDKNFQVVARALEVLRLLAVNPDAPFGRREALVAVAGALDKLADLKLKGPANEALSAAGEAVGPAFVAALLHRRAVGHKNPKVLAEALNWITGAVDAFGLPCFSVPSLLTWCKGDLASPHAGVRTAATSLLGAVHTFVGPALAETVRPDVKPALMTTIEAEFAKRPQLAPGEFVASRVSRAAGASGRSKSSAGGGASGRAPSAAAAVEDVAAAMEELLPRCDISGQVTGSLLANLGSTDWKERKAALDEVEGIVSAAGGRIQPNMGDLMPALKARLADSNKNLVVQTLALLGRLARAMGRPINREGRPLLGPALKCLQDPKANVRGAVIDMLAAWASVAPSEHLFDEVADAIANPKVVGEGMQQALAWIAATLEDGRVGADALPHIARAAARGAVYKTLPVREAAGAALGAAAALFGAGEVAAATKPLKKPDAQAVLEALAKATASSPTYLAAAAAAGSGASRPVSAAGGARGSSTSGGARSSSATTLRPASGRPSGAVGASRGAAAASAGTAAAAVAAAAPSTDSGKLLAMDPRKEERAKKARFKGTKFEMRPEELPALQAELSALASPELRSLLFGMDFRAHCRAADMLRDGLESCFDEAISCLDLILKWAVLRLVEGNTAVLMSVLGMLKTLFDALAATGYRLSDAEAKTFLPGLVEKSGQAQVQLRAACRELMRSVAAVYPAHRILTFVREGLESKNNRTRIACAEEIGCLVEREGARVYCAGGGKSDVLPQLARLVSGDKDIRAACLTSLELIYCFEGEGIWPLLGRLTDQQHSIVEERLKNVDKSLAKQGLAAGYRMGENGGANATDGATNGSAAAGLGAGAGASRGMSDDGPGHPPSSYQPPAAAPAGARAAVAAPAPARGAYTAPGLRSEPSQVTPPVTWGNSGSPEEMEREWRRNLAMLEAGRLEEAVDVMKLLCYEMMEWGKGGGAGAASPVARLMAVNSDRLVSALVSRTHEVFGPASAGGGGGGVPATAAPPNSRAAKYCLNSLMAVFSAAQPPLARAVGETTLRALTTALLLRLVDEQLGSAPEGEALLKALNVLMLKILENSDRTSSFKVLLALLLEAPPEVAGSAERDARWRDLLVKCLIKVTKSLPTTVDSVDVSALLGAIHAFFEALGGEEIRRRGAREDKPLRMVKTILHELCKLKGSAIYAHTGSIPQGVGEAQPIIFPYIDVNLQTLAGSGRPAAAPAGAGMPHTPGGGGIGALRPPLGAAGALTPGHAKGAPATPGVRGGGIGAGGGGGGGGTPGVGLRARGDARADPVREELTEIFKRIGQKEQTEQAITDLYLFLAQRPDVDVNTYMAETSDTFRTFIRRNLARVGDKLAAAGQGAGTRVRRPGPPLRASADVLPPEARAGGGGGASTTPGSGDSAGVSRGSSGGGGGAAAAAGVLRKSSNTAGGANMDQLRDRLKQIQGDVSALQAAPARGGGGGAQGEGARGGAQVNSRLQDLQARLRRLHASDTSA